MWEIVAKVQLKDEFPDGPSWAPVWAFFICGFEIKILVLQEYDIVIFFVSQNSYELHFVQQRWNSREFVVKKLVVPELSHCTLLTHSSPHCVTLTSMLIFAPRGTTCRCKMISNLAIIVLSLDNLQNKSISDILEVIFGKATSMWQTY